MNNDEIKFAKKQIVENLKEGLGAPILDNFVENYNAWNDRMKSVNDIIAFVDSSIPLYKYDEFCKNIIEITKKSLDKVIDYEKLFLTEEEVVKIRNKYKDDERAAEQVMMDELNKKFMNNLIFVLGREHLKESVRAKLKTQFDDIENELDESFDIALSLFKNKNIG